MSSCLGISRTAQFAVRTNCSKTLRHFSEVRTRLIRSCSLVFTGSALITGTLYARLQWKSRVLCRAKTWTRTVDPDRSNGDKEHQFPWKEFFKLLLPDIWFLLGAILVKSFSVYKSKCFLLSIVPISLCLAMNVIKVPQMNSLCSVLCKLLQNGSHVMPSEATAPCCCFVGFSF